MDDQNVERENTVEDSVAAIAFTLRGKIAEHDIENQIPTLRSTIEEIMHDELYDSNAYQLEHRLQLLNMVEETVADVQRNIEELQNREDDFTNITLIEFSHAYASVADLFFSVRNSVLHVHNSLVVQHEAAHLDAALQQAIAEAGDAAVRELGIEETTLQSVEYTQQHIDETKVTCSLCLKDPLPWKTGLYRNRVTRTS